MATSLATARSLLNASEYDLVAASFPRSGVVYTRAVIKQKILRARKLRDQARDLKRRQKIGYRAKTGTKHGGKPGSTALAAARIKVFGEALDRYAAKLEKLNAAERKAALLSKAKDALARKRTAQSPSRPGATPAARRRKGGGKASTRAKPIAGHAKARNAHSRARTARRQAKRDS
jgi:hypothetical protein